MSAADLLLELNRQGIRLEANGDRLRYHPQSALTPDLLARLKAHKAELLAILSTNQQAETAKHGDQPQADQAGQAQRGNDVALAGADSPAAADQPSLVDTARRCLAQRLESLERAGVRQLGRVRPAGEADAPPVPDNPAHAEADRPAATETAASPAASMPAAADPWRPGDGEATDTDATTPEPAADPSGLTRRAARRTVLVLNPDPQRLWQQAVDELAGELPPDVLDGMRDTIARRGGAKPPGPRTYDLRCRCGSAAWNLTVLMRPPHYGYAVRAVCGHCQKVLGLLWWEGGPGNLADDPPGPLGEADAAAAPHPDEPGKSDPGPTPEDVARLLEKAEAAGWPSVKLTPWATLLGGREGWQKFARYVGQRQPTAAADETRREHFRLALAALNANSTL
jgi:hypothetical protein